MKARNKIILSLGLSIGLAVGCPGNLFATADIHPTIAGTLLNSGEKFSSQINGRALDLLDFDDQMSAGKRVWFTTGGSYLDFDGQDNASSGSASGFEVSMGVELAQNDWISGIGLQFNKLELDLTAGASEADLTSVRLAAYSGYQFRFDSGQLKIATGATFGSHEITASRGPIFSQLGGGLESNYNAFSQHYFLTSCFRTELLPELALEPYARLDYGSYHNDSIKENGGIYALHAFGQTNDFFTGTVGVKADYQLSEVTELTLGVGWKNRLKNVDSDLDMAFNSGDDFNVSGASFSRNAAAVNVGLENQIEDNLSIKFDFNGDFGFGSKATTRSAATGTCAWGW